MKKHYIAMSLAVAALGSVILFQNCMDIRLSREGEPEQIQELPAIIPPASGAPAVDPRADTVTYDPSKAVSTDTGCRAFTGELTYLHPINVPSNTTVGGTLWPMRIIGGASLSSDCVTFNNYVFDPLAAGTVDIRHLKFEGVYAFRIRTPANVAYLNGQYAYQNTSGGVTGYQFSISKIPGDINPAKANSSSYCNFGVNNNWQLYAADKGVKDPTICALLQDSVYYLNVLGTVPLVNDGVIDGGDRMEAFVTTQFLTCPGAGAVNGFHCPKLNP